MFVVIEYENCLGVFSTFEKAFKALENKAKELKGILGKCKNYKSNRKDFYINFEVNEDEYQGDMEFEYSISEVELDVEYL